MQQHVLARDFGETVINVYGTRKSPIFAGVELGEVLQRPIWPLIERGSTYYDYGSIEKDGIILNDVLLIQEEGVRRILKQVSNPALLEWLNETCEDLKNSDVEYGTKIKQPNVLDISVLQNIPTDKLTICSRMRELELETEKTRLDIRTRDVEIAKYELEKLRLQLEMQKLSTAPAPSAAPPRKSLKLKEDADLRAWIGANPPDKIEKKEYYKLYLQSHPNGYCNSVFSKYMVQAGYKSVHTSATEFHWRLVA